MSPILLYILNVIQKDMAAQPNAYGNKYFKNAWDYVMRSSQYHRDQMAEWEIPWTY